MSDNSDPFDLMRFVSAQAGCYPQVFAELRRGQKCSHWMWFVFPQLAGLGHSAAASFYALSSRAEAAAYLTHPLLGDRLRACTQIVNALQNRSAQDIFGSPDDLKFHSSMTLFKLVEPTATEFGLALDRYYAGVPDARTLTLWTRLANAV